MPCTDWQGWLHDIAVMPPPLQPPAAAAAKPQPRPPPPLPQPQLATPPPTAPAVYQADVSLIYQDLCIRPNTGLIQPNTA